MGVIQLIVVLPPSPDPVTLEGLSGIPAGITEVEPVELEVDVPAVLVAVDVNV